MNRSSFFKGLAALVVAPLAIAEVIKDTPIANEITASTTPTVGLFNDLNLLTPTFHKEYIEKYSDTYYIDYSKGYESRLEEEILYEKKISDLYNKKPPTGKRIEINKNATNLLADIPDDYKKVKKVGYLRRDGKVIVFDEIPSWAKYLYSDHRIWTIM